jgi:hypothetical protein
MRREGGIDFFSLIAKNVNDDAIQGRRIYLKIMYLI